MPKGAYTAKQERKAKRPGQGKHDAPPPSEVPVVAAAPAAIVPAQPDVEETGKASENGNGNGHGNGHDKGNGKGHGKK